METKGRSTTVALLLAALSAWPATRAVAEAPPESFAVEDEKEGREEELYDEGTEAIDDEKWDRAVRAFTQVAAMGGRRADAGLYWKAYAEKKAGQRAAASSTLAELRKKHPQSRWLDEATALELELKQAGGQTVTPDAGMNEDLKLIALNSLMHADAERAVPMLETFLAGGSSPKLKERALFVLSQSGSPQAREVVARVARGERNVDMQRTAIKYLGLFGGEESRKVMADIYASNPDPRVKKSILHGFMLAGDKARVLAAARGEADTALRKEAIHQLGLMGAQPELWELYKADANVEVRKAVLHALFLGGAADRLAEIARTDRDVELRRSAIRNLGLVGAARSNDVLMSIYQAETEPKLRREVIQAFFISGNASALIRIARSEKDPELRRAAVHQLSLMGNKEATEYMLEILNR